MSTKVAIVTGGSNGIGAATGAHLNRSGTTVIIVELASTERSAQELIAHLPSPSGALFFPADITDWHFNRLDLVIANAGTMEHTPILEDTYDENGELEAPTEAYRTVDTNLKGSLNTLKLAIHYLKSAPSDSCRSIVLVASTAGYFDGAGTVAYTTSKQGVVRLLRSSQGEAVKHNIRINAIAPFFTTTHLTSGIADAWVQAGLLVNSPDSIAEDIVDTALESSKSGRAVLVTGKYVQDLEHTRMELLSSWVGDEVAEFMGRAGEFFSSIGGYILPGPRDR
ncbi:hypothetical protein BDV12DRAFT_186976 [Aspergillus spectabilis]